MPRPSHSAPSKAEAKRSYLIEQATRCLSEKGSAHVSLRDIAKTSGVSLGILHYYFASKEDLLLAVISSYKETFIQELEKILAHGPQDGWMERLLDVLRRALTDNRAMHRLWCDLQVQALYVPAFREPVREIRSRLQELIVRMLAQFFPDDTHALTMSRDEAASLIYAQIEGLFLQAMLEEEAPAQAASPAIEQHLSRLLGVLLAPAAPFTPVQRGES